MFEWLSKHPAVSLVGAALVLVVAAFLVARTVNPPAPPPTAWAQVWCYDLANRKIFVGSEAQAPPFIIAGAGQTTGTTATGVRAEVYSCGSCEVESQRFAAWIWKFNDTTRDVVQGAIDASRTGFVEDSPYDLPAARADPNAMLIATPEQPGDWFPEPSEEAQQIMTGLAGRCGGKAPSPCTPAAAPAGGG